MWKFIKSWRGVVPGDRYASDHQAGKRCPDELVDELKDEGVISFFEETSEANDEAWTAAGIGKAKKAELIAFLEADDSGDVEWSADMTVPVLRQIILENYQF